MSIQRLLELHELARQECRKYTRKRFLFTQLVREEGRHFTGIVGARGTGKTVLLRQYALEHEDAFYLSADTLEPDDDAWELIRKLAKQYGFRTFLLDEVHFLPDPTGLLKRLYDFLDVRILFSSSVALAMRASAHDLSRRVRLLELHVFSFREFLAFTQDLSLPSSRLGANRRRAVGSRNTFGPGVSSMIISGAGSSRFRSKSRSPLVFWRASLRRSSPGTFLL